MPPAGRRAAAGLDPRQPGHASPLESGRQRFHLTPGDSVSASDKDRVTSALDRVIVGNGAAAAEAALALRRAGYGGRVDLFADGARPPYNPMLGSHYVSGELEGRRCSLR